MMADHGDPCNELEATYCMNGATCYKLPSMDTLSCVCRDSYKGSRCEQFQLLIVSGNARENGLIAAVVIVAILILVILVVVIHYTCKMLRAKSQTQPSSGQYWKVKPRV